MFSTARTATTATLLAALTAVGLAWASASDTAPLQSYVTSISAQLDPRVSQTLAQLDGTGRQLLAMRSYLRSASHLAERWSWTQEQIEAFAGSPEQRDLQEQIDRVRAAFVAANPGYELYVNSRVRSLDEQVENWNSNESVKAAADEILVAAQALIASPGFPADRPEQARQALKTFLSGHRPVPTADDRGTRVVFARPDASNRLSGASGRAGHCWPSTATIATDWAAAGWAAKLDAAVRAASDSFVGPQASPPRRGTTNYLPEAVAQD